jgi:hypothetical protein
MSNDAAHFLIWLVLLLLLVLVVRFGINIDKGKKEILEEMRKAKEPAEYEKRLRTK